MTRNNTTLSACLLLALVLLASSAALSQGVTTAGMNGLVHDRAGQPLPGAVVVATHIPSGSVFGTNAREDGRYNIQGLRVGGPYKVSVKLIGFKPASQGDITLALGENRRLDYMLIDEAVQVGEVQVTAERGSIISQARTGASTNVSKEAIERLPTISRSFQALQSVAPQFLGNAAAGRNNRFNNIQIDGVQYNDLFGLGSSGTPGGQASTQPISLDALQEFQVLIAPYDVRQNGFTGGGVNAITRSGTNDYTGSVFFFGRDQNQTGLSILEPHTKVADFTDFQMGFRAGGPIMQDKLFFFANGELDRRLSPSDIALKGQTGATGSNVSGTPVDSAARFAADLRNRGYDPGSYDPYKYARDSKKLFLRLDYNISDQHRLTVRHNLVDAFDDNLTRTTAAFFFSNTSYRFNSNTNQTVAQLTSSFGSQFANEAILGYTRIRDSRDFAGSPFPYVQINKVSGFANLAAGSENFSVANSLDQDIFEFTDNFTWFNGPHTITVGTHNEFYKFANLFIRNLYGYYEFPSIGAFELGRPSNYQVSYSTTGDPKWAAQFSAIQPGFYIQDEWQIAQNFKITAGVRVDIPILPDKPSKNPYVDTVFAGKYETNQVPSGNLLWSPRLGFNWDVNNDKTTQMRGGAGIFSGRVPYVWISNQYGNTGNELARVNSNGPTGGFANGFFNPDPYNQPRPGITPGLVPVASSEVDITAPDFKMPQLARFNIAIDRQLPILDLFGTLEFIYSRSLNDITYQDVNIQPIDSVSAYDGRALMGRPITTGTTWRVNKLDPNHFTNVILMKNTNDGYQWNLTVQIQRPIRDGLFGSIAYTYGRAKDRNSVISSQAYSQWRFNYIGGNPNDPPLTYSNFDRPHRIGASLSYQHEWLVNAPTTISVFYRGYSGEPYSYLYFGDVNGDGETGNDLLYVPKNASDIILTTNNYAALDAYIEGEDYLKENRGKIVPRNGGRNPWIAHVDLHLAQQIPIPMLQGHNLEVSLDVLNIMNLISYNMGRERYAPNQSYQLLTYQGIDAATKRPKFSYTPPKNSVPWQYDDLASRWQAQLGVRYSF